jgi:hypothetical protein
MFIYCIAWQLQQIKTPPREGLFVAKLTAKILNYVFPAGGNKSNVLHFAAVTAGPRPASPRHATPGTPFSEPHLSGAATDLPPIVQLARLLGRQATREAMKATPETKAVSHDD